MGKRKIIWSHRAQIKLFNILDFYAERNKSKTYSKKLYHRFKKEIKLLEKQPDLGIKTDDITIRGFIILDYIIFYEITTNSIIIHTIWDCRQNPDDLIIK